MGRIFIWSYLTSCHWEPSQKDITCLITPKNPQADEVINIEDVSVDLRNNDGTLISSELYHSESTIVNGSLVLSITLSDEVKTEDFSVQISAKTGKNEGKEILSSLLANNIYPEEPQIEIFSEPNFAGASVSLNFGESSQQADFPSLENSVSSIKTPEGLAVTLCNEAKSKCMDLYGNTKNLQSLNALVSTIKVYQSEAFATIFEHFSWNGKNQKIPLGVSAGDDIIAGVKNRVSSFHIPEQHTLKACKDVKGEEPCHTFTEDKYRLPGDQNDKFKFLEFSHTTNQ
ncbi:MAG: hypothetical protein HRU09_20380 [Oligoflexales bacterium]|nr:hypothetical protein [Oligoflexales bacterium]